MVEQKEYTFLLSRDEVVAVARAVDEWFKQRLDKVLGQEQMDAEEATTAVLLLSVGRKLPEVG